MKKLLLLLFLGMITSLNAQDKKLEILLFELPDVIFKKIETAKNFEATYEIKIKQAVDHSDASKGYFYQKVFLSHKGFDKPTVIITEGYNRDTNRIYELTELLDANQIDVEHRYFGESIPNPLDYKYLNLEQACGDLHHIKQVFADVYQGKWISTGISKGGATTIFYKYFYPNDVDVSVPYVAPINNSFEDPRIYTFLDTIGSVDCRNKIKDLQVKLLKNRDKIVPLLTYYTLGAREKFTYLDLNKAFEFAVLEYPFSFWQYGHSCDAIPNKKASVEEMLSYFLGVSDLFFFADSAMSTYGSHYYQSATEMGYYGYETDEFKDLLTALPTDSNPHATFLPNKMTATFDGRLLQNVNAWLTTEANNFLYIYGEIDTWSATAVRPNSNVNSKWFFMDDKHHGNARIANMTEAEKEIFVTTLEKWLSIKIE